MENLFDANKPEYLLGVLRNVENNIMPKSHRSATSNIALVKKILTAHTNCAGMTSAYEMCEFLGIDPHGYTFNIPPSVTTSIINSPTKHLDIHK